MRNIPVRTGNCVETLGAAGTITASLKLPMQIPDVPVDPSTGKLPVVPIRDLLQPGKSFLGWEEDGVILNAGPIWSDTYTPDNKEHIFNAAGLRSYWQYRYVLPALAQSSNTPIGRDSSYTNLSLRTIAKRLIQQSQSWTGGTVPVVLESDFSGSNARTYLGHELHIVEEKLKQLSEVQGGPDIMFRARYTNASRTHVEWLMETGDPELRRPGAPHKFDSSSGPNPSVKEPSVTRDASVLSNVNYQIGATVEDGSSQDGYPMIGMKKDTYLSGIGYPILESSEDRSSVATQSVLDAHAQAAVDAGKYFAETWQFRSKKSIAPYINEYRAGDYAVLSTKDDPALGTGEHLLRIMSISSTVGDDFALINCAPRRTLT